ncbi:MAG TPA: bifunctional phosphopantothenoylcysteine decarboxylase/phosphopantothenate--cysteine ligase CoaBC [Oculatellaceae cyanobacterium]|jgi:phosphopantothenoylcysteine decarboxylase/phosphopantothenate--cysteine ligase
MDFSGKTIVIGITGGIAAYKACDLIRELYRLGAERVICILTPSAEAFVTPLTLQALSRQPVYSSELAVDPSGTPIHIVLAQQADALLILPATADCIAKLANGFSDNLVTTTAITFTGKPVLIAPAMNTRMWQHPLTQENVRKLESLPDYTIIYPSHGQLACGETGEGHLADQTTILQHLYRMLHPQAGLYRGVKALVTAGGTFEPIDPVRVISNRSSGKMGLALADELWAMGADVTLVTTMPPSGRLYKVLSVQTANDMREAVLTHAPENRVIFMAAAVSDYAVANASPQKIKREREASPSIELVPNPDILAELGQQKHPEQILIGFAAETENLLKNASDKLQRKNLDAIVANDISRTDIGFAVDENEVTILFADQSQCTLPKAPKAEIAQQLLELLARRLNSPRTASSV